MNNHQNSPIPEEPTEDADNASVDEDVHHDESRKNAFDPEVARKLHPGMRRNERVRVSTLPFPHCLA